MSAPTVNNDLADFMHQVTREMASEYNRLEKRAREDPGTAGDNGEENWATLFRNWLPPSYQVVTKGRILSQSGIATPQIDVIILRPSYPRGLLETNTKLYLAPGVAAAFECKLTLRASHITNAIENSIIVHRQTRPESTDPNYISTPRIGTPYKELHSSIIYGLLAHSHSWKQPGSTPEVNIHNQLIKADLSRTMHPTEQLDLICVADLAQWSLSKWAWFGPPFHDFSIMPEQNRPVAAGQEGPHTFYSTHSPQHNKETASFTPIGSAITHLLLHLAYEDHTLRELASYFRIANLEGVGLMTAGRRWPVNIYSSALSSRFAAPLSFPRPKSWWDEWSLIFA